MLGPFSCFLDSNNPRDHTPFDNQKKSMTLERLKKGIMEKKQLKDTGHVTVLGHFDSTFSVSYTLVFF